MKYIIDIPDDRIGDFVGSTHLLMPYTMAGHEGQHDTGLALTPYDEPDRETIEDEVWSFAWKISSMDIREYAGIFDDKGCPSDYREAKAKYGKWLKQKDEIHVGDEIILGRDLKMVVIQITDNETTIQGVDENGECYECIELNEVKKTGRHFDEVAELLEKMRVDA